MALFFKPGVPGRLAVTDLVFGGRFAHAAPTLCRSDHLTDRLNDELRLGLGFLLRQLCLQPDVADRGDVAEALVGEGRHGSSDGT